jgi:hypothetical protein
MAIEQKDVQVSVPFIQQENHILRFSSMEAKCQPHWRIRQRQIVTQLGTIIHSKCCWLCYAICYATTGVRAVAWATVC